MKYPNIQLKSGPFAVNMTDPEEMFFYELFFYRAKVLELEKIRTETKPKNVLLKKAAPIIQDDDVDQQNVKKEQYTTHLVEPDLFEESLHTLLALFDEPSRKAKRGRKPVPFKDKTFVSVMKVYLGLSGRAVASEMQNYIEKGYIKKPIHYNSILRWFEDGKTIDRLICIVEECSNHLGGIKVVIDQFVKEKNNFSSLQSKTSTAQTNELFCNILCYSLTNLIITGKNNDVRQINCFKNNSSTINMPIGLNRFGLLDIYRKGFIDHPYLTALLFKTNSAYNKKKTSSRISYWKKKGWLVKKDGKWVVASDVASKLLKINIKALLTLYSDD